MVPRYAMSLHFFVSFVMTCMAMSVQAELTKVPLRPYLRGNPGLLPQTISSHQEVEDCKGQTGCLLKDGVPLPELISIAPLSDLASPDDRRFPFDAFIDQKTEACPDENNDNTENDDEDDDNGNNDDDSNEEDCSGEEGGDDDNDEGDPEEDPAANGNEGSDDGDNEEGDDCEEEEEDEEEDEDQPPVKKRK